jgi:hypothetical protein
MADYWCYGASFCTVMRLYWLASFTNDAKYTAIQEPKCYTTLWEANALWGITALKATNYRPVLHIA